MNENIYIILVRPQLGQNIGAVARAMKNFAFVNLRIIAPRDGWPSDRARELAVGAADILERAELFENLEDAISDLHKIYGCTARQRFLNKAILHPDELATELSGMAKYKIGIMFGPENNGLSNDDISYIDKIVTIPVNPDFSSLNIAQSAIVVFYELFKNNIALSKPELPFEMASGREVTELFNHLECELSSKNFFKVEEKKEGMIMNIRGMFKRIENFSSQDVRTFRGMIKALTKK